MSEEQILAHYGVPGMKWGVRKKQSLSDKAKAAESTVSSKAFSDSKSHYRTMIEARYLKRGASIKESQILADKSIRAHKIIAASTAVAVTAAVGAIAAQHIGKQYVGVTLKQGATLQHLSRSDKLNLAKDRHLYTTYNKIDKLNYQGAFSWELGGLKGVPVSQINLKTSGKIKAPSNAEAKKIYEEVLGKKVEAKNYKNFIRSLNLVDQSSNKTYGNFKEALKAKGYNALIDSADQKASSLKAFKPLIVFDSGENLVEKGSRVLSSAEISKKLNMGNTVRAVLDKQHAVRLTTAAAVSTTLASTAYAVEKTRIDNYYKQNPKTNLSRAEVALELKLVA